MNSSVLAIIPAKSRSTGIPGKNWKPLCGLPPVYRAYDVAKQVADRVIISTDTADDFEPWDTIQPRPLALCADDTPMIDVIKHVLEQIPGPPDQAILLLQPTQPLREPKHLTAALEALTDDWDSVVTITPIPRSHAPDLVLSYSNSSLTVGPYSWRDDWANRPTRRQALSWPYIADGTAYCFWRKTVDQHGNIYGEAGHVRGLIIDPAETCALDTLEDWTNAERRLRERSSQA